MLGKLLYANWFCWYFYNSSICYDISVNQIWTIIMYSRSIRWHLLFEWNSSLLLFLFTFGVIKSTPWTYIKTAIYLLIRVLSVCFYFSDKKSWKAHFFPVLVFKKTKFLQAGGVMPYSPPPPSIYAPNKTMNWNDDLI
jgi:hypothetical protein